MSRDMRSLTIGFVGLGRMGTPMASNLAKAGFRLLVHDADAGAVQRVAQGSSCRAATSSRQVGEESDILILMLPDGRIVREFFLGGGEPIIGRLKRSATVIDMSSSDPLGTRELGSILAAGGVALVDAPVSGGVPRATSGKLAIMVGGDETVAAGLSDIFSALGEAAYVGSLGSGHAMKALNNYVSAAGLLAACEALTVAEKFGLAGETIVKVLNSSTGRNNSTENKLMQYIVPETFNSGFSLGLMHKDLATALNLARGLDIEPPMAGFLVSLWAEAERRFGKGADHTEIARLVDEASPGSGKEGSKAAGQ